MEGGPLVVKWGVIANGGCKDVDGGLFIVAYAEFSGLREFDPWSVRYPSHLAIC